jgi:hypothetical protein
MSATGPDDVREALLRDRDPGAVVGLRECAWLDVKSGPYRLDTAWGRRSWSKTWRHSRMPPLAACF